MIESALATCEAMLAWLTPDFSGSRWTDQEVGFCVGRAVLVIPVRRGLDPYGFIGKHQASQAFEKDVPSVADEIRQILITHELTATRMVAPTVRSFAAAWTFDEARKEFSKS
jgi:hypothetical protein